MISTVQSTAFMSVLFGSEHHPRTHANVRVSIDSDRSAFLTGARLFFVSLTLMLGACSGGGGGGGDGSGLGPEQPSDDVSESESSCSVVDQNSWVYDNMLDYYLFFDQVPVADPSDFESPRELISELRFEERDSFSFITDQAAEELETVQGREFGLGYFWQFDDDGNVRIDTVYRDSPFGRAGVTRGDIVLTINDRPASTALDDTEFVDSQIFGSEENPQTSTWQFETGVTGETRTLQFTSTEYEINTVLASQTLVERQSGTRVGYLAFERFLVPSDDELQSAFTRFASSGIDELVVDLRYNGGGRIVIAELLASLIAGERNSGSLLYRYEFNPNYTDSNFELEFQDNVGDLNLSRVIFLTRSFTASSSEIVIGGLQPYLDVVVLGQQTTGKPFIQSGNDRCEQRLFLVEAEGFNAAGNSVFGGIDPTCSAFDDVTRDFGLDENTGEVEGMLQSALDFISDGSCAPPVTANELRISERHNDRKAGQRGNSTPRAIR